MKFTPRNINRFNFLKLPAAYFTGVRARYIDQTKCIVTVKHSWINQNPFNSMFWAVQGMAAELTTGALLLSKIKTSGYPISMLVVNINGNFTKKATGRITFECTQGNLIELAIQKAVETREGQTIWLKATGKNKENIQVSSFDFQWTIKLKN
ncbi:MAG TPA: DUF4442 domain-containing protein [Flavobacteriaceae bacterium]|nr:DUF4442 domain-containing protein [Flavobacteriaceae bacterium]